MKIASFAPWTAAAALCLGASAASAAHIDKFVCKRQSGGPMASFAMTIDFDAKTVALPADTGFQPDTETVQVSAASVSWSFMRGFVEFDRHTGELAWDTTAEYDYLAAIGHAPDAPETDYKGRLQCEADSAR